MKKLKVKVKYQNVIIDYNANALAKFRKLKGGEH